jgi:penicillin-binding protein 3
VKYKRWLLCSLLFLSIISLIGCSKAKTPKDNFQEYAILWQKSDFTSMYKLLSIDTKKGVDEKYFTDRYKKIYKDAKINKITISPEFPQKFIADKDGKVHFPISITLETPIGNIPYKYEVSLVNEKQGKSKSWYVVWDEKMILPNFDKAYSVKYDKLLGKRGEIKDKNNQGLAVNRPAVAIGIVPNELGADKDTVEKQLSSILNIGVEDIESQLNQKWAKDNPNQFVPIINVANNEIDKISKSVNLHKAVKNSNLKSTMRVYPAGEAAAHLIGYIGNINEEELKNYKVLGYDENDVIGKTGLESIYEKRLRGEVGGAINIVDDKGTKKNILQRLPRDGEDITLTIDSNLQKDIYAGLSGDMGAAVATNPKTGEVLAMVSSPSYNPNLLSSSPSNKYYLSLEKDPKKPLISRFDKATVPGSTFKPITAAIGLRSGKLNPDIELKIEGAKWQKSDWGSYSVTRKHTNDTSVNLLDAFVNSDNIYFAQTALSIQKDEFLKGAKDFGIGEKMTFPFPMQPSQIGTLESETELADSGYGQGKVIMNPLHLALIYGSFVNEGNVLSPIIEVKDKSDTPKIWKEKVVSKEISDLIVNDLIQVIENPIGTGHGAKVSGVTFAGKTGTAELKTTQDTQGKEYGWFAAFNTVNPKFAMVMMIEDVPNNEGSGYVVPKAYNIMKNINKY